MRKNLVLVIMLSILFTSNAFALDVNGSLKGVSSTLGGGVNYARSTLGGVKNSVLGKANSALGTANSAISYAGKVKQTFFPTGIQQSVRNFAGGLVAGASLHLSNAAGAVASGYNSIPHSIFAASADSTIKVPEEYSQVNTSTSVSNSHLMQSESNKRQLTHEKYAEMNKETAIVSNDNKIVSDSKLSSGSGGTRINGKGKEVVDYGYITTDNKRVVIPTNEYLTPAELRGMHQRGEVQVGDSRRPTRESLTPNQKVAFDNVKANPYQYQNNVALLRDGNGIVRNVATSSSGNLAKNVAEVQAGNWVAPTPKPTTGTSAGSPVPSPVTMMAIPGQVVQGVKDAAGSVAEQITVMGKNGTPVVLMKSQSTYGGLPFFKVQGSTSTNLTRFNRTEMKNMGVKINQDFDGARIQGWN